MPCSLMDNDLRQMSTFNNYRPYTTFLFLTSRLSLSRNCNINKKNRYKIINISIIIWYYREYALTLHPVMRVARTLLYVKYRINL